MKWIEELPGDFRKICQAGAKVYLTKDKRFGVVTGVTEEEVSFNVGSKRDPLPYKLSVYEFIEGLKADKVVPKNRIEMGDNGIKIKPRSSEFSSQPISTPEPAPVQSEAVDPPRMEIMASESISCDSEDLEVGYLHLRTNKFSKEPKSGYSKIFYRFEKKEFKVKVTPEQLKELKKLGIL